MLDHWLSKFPTRSIEIYCAYIVILRREDLKTRVSELSQLQIEKFAQIAPMEVIWHCEDVQPSLSRRPKHTVLMPAARSDTVTVTGESLLIPVGKSGTPTEWSWKQKVAFHDELMRPEGHVEGYSWLNCGWDRYG